MNQPLTTNNFQAKSSPAMAEPGQYYASVQALTIKETTNNTSLPPAIDDSLLSLLFSPYLLWGCLALFFVLLLGGLGMQIAKRILDIKRTAATFVVALIIALLPYSMKTALEVTTIRTFAGPDEVPRGIKINQSSTRSFTVNWKTETAKTGAVRIGVTPLSETNSQVVIGDLGQKTTSHTVKLEDLQPGIEYEIEILSGKAWYNDDGKPIKIRLN